MHSILSKISIEGKMHPSKFCIGAFGHNDQPHEKRFCSTPVAHGVIKNCMNFVHMDYNYAQ